MNKETYLKTLIISPIRNGYLIDNAYYQNIEECLKEAINELEGLNLKKEFKITIKVQENVGK